MDKAIIGAILKRRIKEKKYTQEKFAEEVGVKYSTLKKYLSGKSAYSYELLLEFAEKLDCSVEYLLGLSKSPIKEHHEIAEQTRLSEEAIAKIVGYAKEYDTDFEARRFIRTIDLLLCENGAINSICDFFIASKFMNQMVYELVDMLQTNLNNIPAIKNLGMEKDREIPIETQYMINVVMKLKDIKAKITPEFIAEIKALDTKEKLQTAMAKTQQHFDSFKVITTEEYEKFAKG